MSTKVAYATASGDATTLTPTEIHRYDRLTMLLELAAVEFHEAKCRGLELFAPLPGDGNTVLHVKFELDDDPIQ